MRGAASTLASRRERASELAGLLNTSLRSAQELGARRVIKRSVDAADAVISVARELAQADGEVRYAAALRMVFERLGATYIKVGQFIASSPAFFDSELVHECGSLLDQTSPTPWPFIRATIMRELNISSLYDVFESVDPRPLASASVAQVHAATLRSSGKDVVIKVCKPGIEDALTTDLAALKQAAQLLEIVQPELSRTTSLTGITEDIATSIADEADFLNEVENIKSFKRYLQTSEMDAVAKAPHVYEQLSTKQMIVMERFFGHLITDTTHFSPSDVENAISNTLNVWLGSLGACEAIHVDVHPGNILLCNDGRVGWLDFGICARLKQSTVLAVPKLFEAIGERDSNTMARALVTIGATSDSNVDIDGFARELDKALETVSNLVNEMEVRTAVVDEDTTFAQTGLSVDTTKLNQFVEDTVRISEQFGLRVPREFGLLLKQVLYFNRLTEELAPTISLFDSRIDMHGKF